MATSIERPNGEMSGSGNNGITSHSPSQIATTSAVTLEQTPSHSSSIKEEDEDAKLFASLVNGIQTGAVSSAMTSMPISSTADLAENTDSNTAWSNAMSSLQGVTIGSFPSLDLVQSISNGALGISDPLNVGLNDNPSDLAQSDLKDEEDIPPEPISAYAKLEFPGFSYYIQTLDFTIGRRPAEFRSQSSHQQHITDTGKSLGDVDVDLGPVKSISRFHVRIFHQEPNWPGYSPYGGTQVRFVLQVLGRNGCFVDDVPIGKGSIVPLGKRTKIQIAERVFYFVLPPTHSLHVAMDEEGEEEASIGSSAEEQSEDGIEDDDDDDESSSGSLGGSSDEEESEEESVGNKKSSLKKIVQPGQGKGGKGKGKGIEPMEVDDGEINAKSDSIRKRKRGDPMEEESGVLKVGTPIGVEALNLNKRKKKSDSNELLESSPPKSGKGKGAGKAAIVSAAMARARADVEAIQAVSEANLSAAAAAAAAAARGSGDTTPSTPTTSDATPVTSASKMPASDKSKKPLPPAGAGVKPDKSNMDLIREAMNGPLSVSRGGKMALQEIYEYLTSTYEWFRNNSRANGRDWHSAIRHAVENARDMDRIPRKAHEPGKGVFYAFADSNAAKAAKAEAAEASAIQSDTTNAATPTPPPSSLPLNNATASSGLSTSLSTPMKETAAGAKNASTSKLNTPKAELQTTATSDANKTAGTNSNKATGKADNKTATSSNDSTTRDSTPSSTTPASAIAADGRVRIVVGKAPDDALAQMAAAPKAAITQSIEALFGGPPIVHHEGTLFLSPIVFGSMSAQEISDIGGKGAQQALATLQAKLVAHLQSKMTAGAASPPPPSSPVTGNAQQSPASVPSPNINPVRPPMNNNNKTANQVTSNPTGTNARPALVRPGNTTSARPPIQPRPPIARPAGNGITNNVRPSTIPSTTSIGRPTNVPTPSTTARPMNRPPLTNTMVRPTGQSGPLARPITPGIISTRPGRPPLQPRPAVQGPSASIARPTTTVPTSTPGVRPSSSITTNANTNLSRPNTIARPIGAGTTVGRPPLVRPGNVTTVNTNNNTGIRPVVAPTRPPLHNAQRPLSGVPNTGITAGIVGGVRPGIIRPGAGRPPLSARPRPPLPGQQVGRPPNTAAAAAIQAGTAKVSLPSTSNTSVTASSVARPVGTTTAAIRPTQRPPSANSSGGTSSSGSNGTNTSNNAISAVSNVASTTTPSSSNASTSQSDMAALLALLTGGKLDNSKLTPAQQQLLQRAGRLAAEQQKAQQQKVAATVIAGTTGVRSPSPVKSTIASTSGTPIKTGLMTTKSPASAATTTTAATTSTTAAATGEKSGEEKSTVNTPSKESSQTSESK